LREQLSLLHSLADVVVLDTGSDPTLSAHPLWLAAKLVIAVSTIDAVAIMETYAMVKQASTLGGASQGRPALATLINQTTGETDAWEAHQRIAASCRRFLNLAIGSVGHVPWDPAVPQAAGTGRPFALSASDSVASQAVKKIARSLACISPTARQSEESERVANRQETTHFDSTQGPVASDRF
jgi:flagellar biosynthesis protein FlhG